MPFFRVFKNQFFDGKELSEEQIGILVSLTHEVFARLETELQLKGFWDSIPAVNRLKASLQELLLAREFYDKLPGVFPKRGEIISRILEIAESNHDTILYAA